MDTWKVAEAKAKLSKLLERSRSEGPQQITRNGKRIAVVVAAEEWDRRTARRGSLVEFLDSSPLRGSGLELERTKGKGLEIEL